jgi:hypothetical protein
VLAKLNKFVTPVRLWVVLYNAASLGSSRDPLAYRSQPSLCRLSEPLCFLVQVIIQYRYCYSSTVVSSTLIVNGFGSVPRLPVGRLRNKKTSCVPSGLGAPVIPRVSNPYDYIN